jgi:hypothetical protein
MLLAQILLILSLTIGTVLYFCVHLSPLINMIFNFPILLLWTAGMGLMIWNMYGTLGHSCSINNWGNEDGVSICNQYKALFAFVVIGWLCQIALLVLDVRARRSQSAWGKYKKMGESQDYNMKMDALHTRDNSVQDSVHNLPLGAGMDGAAQRLQHGDAQPLHRAPSQRAASPQNSYYSNAPPTYTTEPRYQDTPYSASTAYQTGEYQAYNPAPTTRFDPAYSSGQNMHSMNDFQYNAPAPTGYYNQYGR